MDKNLIRNLIMYGCLCVLTSCTTGPTQQQTQLQDEPSSSAEQEQLGVPQSAPPVVPYFIREPVTQKPVTNKQEPQTSIRKGSGVFVRETAADTVIPEPVSTAEKNIAEAGDITLNFKAADLHEFIRVVFEEILKQNYLIDPSIEGVVTLHTTYPVTQDAILPIMESILQQNGAAVIFQQGIYKVVSLEDAPGQVSSPAVGKQPAAQGCRLLSTDRSSALCGGQ